MTLTPADDLVAAQQERAMGEQMDRAMMEDSAPPMTLAEVGFWHLFSEGYEKPGLIAELRNARVSPRDFEALKGTDTMAAYEIEIDRTLRPGEVAFEVRIALERKL